MNIKSNNLSYLIFISGLVAGCVDISNLSGHLRATNTDITQVSLQNKLSGTVSLCRVGNVEGNTSILPANNVLEGQTLYLSFYAGSGTDNYQGAYYGFTYDSTCTNPNYYGSALIISDGATGLQIESYTGNIGYLDNLNLNFYGGGNFYITGQVAGPTPPAPSLPAATTYSTIQYRGFNASGLEWGGTDPAYYPDISWLTYFGNKGMNTVRLPVKWELLQPKLQSEIDWSGSYQQYIVNYINLATSAGYNVILDLHNNMQYCSPNCVYVSTQDMENVWSQIGTQFKNNSRVIFDIMNEPTDTNSNNLLKETAGLKGLYDVGATNLALIEGGYWTSVSTWTTSNYNGGTNATVFSPSSIESAQLQSGFSYPNYAINVHIYFNSTTGGGTGTTACIDPSTVLNVEQTTQFANWMKQSKAKVILSELGGINTSSNCPSDIDTFLQFVESNADQNDGNGGFIGWAGWASYPSGISQESLSFTPFILGPNGQFADLPTMTNGYLKHLAIQTQYTLSFTGVLPTGRNYSMQVHNNDWSQTLQVAGSLPGGSALASIAVPIWATGVAFYDSTGTQYNCTQAVSSIVNTLDLTTCQL